MIKPSLLDINRINALTDATFGVAMTILILSIEMPQGLSTEKMHIHFYQLIFPSLLIYILSFIILGSFWNESHHHNHLVYKSDVLSSWLYILFLMFICIIPFSSHFVLHYPKERTSVLFYLINLLAAKSINTLLFFYTWKKKYLKPNISIYHCRSVLIRNSIPTILFLFGIPIAYFFTSWALYFFPIPLLIQFIISVLDSLDHYSEDDN